MNNDNNKKSNVKGIAILSAIFIPLFIIFFGRYFLDNDTYYALFLGFFAAFLTLVIVSNLFKELTVLWWVSTIVIFIMMVTCYLLEQTSIVMFVLIALSGCALLLVIIKWISGDLSRK